MFHVYLKRIRVLYIVVGCSWLIRLFKSSIFLLIFILVLLIIETSFRSVPAFTFCLALLNLLRTSTHPDTSDLMWGLPSNVCCACEQTQSEIYLPFLDCSLRLVDLSSWPFPATTSGRSLHWQDNWVWALPIAPNENEPSWTM